MSLFGAHDRNKSPSVGSRDHFPLRHHSRNSGYHGPALLQLGVVLVLCGVPTFRHGGAIRDLDAFGFIGMRLHQHETEHRSSSDHSSWAHPCSLRHCHGFFGHSSFKLSSSLNRRISSDRSAWSGADPFCKPSACRPRLRACC